MGDYDYMMSAWKDKRTGLCHLSLKGSWAGYGNYEEISMEEYRKWQKTMPVSHGGVLPNPIQAPGDNTTHST